MINEEKWLEYWEKNKIFEKSISQRKKGKFYSFYDGPPFATGLPHYGHILGSVIKDVVPRYFAMKGYKVLRRWGWDCHGLPIENIIEKKFNINSKKEIEKLGIDKFNSAAREAVLTYDREWKKTIRRIARFVDFENSYKTMDNSYMETVWWVFKELWNKKLIYEDSRISLYCPRCSTPLSNFEIAMDNSYKEVDEIAVAVKLNLTDEKNTSLIIWTTTPWTLIGNVAVAVNPDLVYVKIKIRSQKKEKEECLILAKSRLDYLKGYDYEIIKEFKGKELNKKKYQKLYKLDEHSGKNDYYGEMGWYVIMGDFVSKEEGTGIVHLALYGEDDYKMAKKYNLPLVRHIGEDGCLISGPKNWLGIWYKDLDSKIIEDLKDRNLLFKSETHSHSYPFCYRCETPLYYALQPAWFVNIGKIRKKMIEANKKINWKPGYLKNGRFLNGLKTAPDWNLSRSRYWGSPMPVWKCENCGEVKIIGSIKELKKKSNANKLPINGKGDLDLHRPYIDEIKFKCEKCGKLMNRIKDVFDCWFESGSMPYAEKHYPFENKKEFLESFPADFVAEYIAQTRGWFYTLHVLSTALFNKPAFKNVITTGTILAESGEKMSKSKKNYPDPWLLFEKYSVDALRYYLMASPVMLTAENINFSEINIRETQNKVISTLENAGFFFKLYAAKKIKFNFEAKKISLLDKWILSLTESLIKETDSNMRKYEITRAVRPISKFIDDLSNWYIRRSRKRFQNNESILATSILSYVLIRLSKIISIFTPFIAEEIYQKVKIYDKNRKLSVHLTDYPKYDKRLINKNLEKKMEIVRENAALGLKARNEIGIKVRQPLAALKIKNFKFNFKKDAELLNLIKEEVNIKEIVFDKNLKTEVWLDTEITPELKEEGILRDITRAIQDLRKKAGLTPSDTPSLLVFANNKGNEFLQKYGEKLIKETKFSKIEIGKTNNISNSIKLDGIEIDFSIK